MSEDDIEFIKQWYIKADHDILAAKTLIEIKPTILDTACFHCQQAVEKYLKAYLLYKRYHFNKTHNLIDLQNICVEFDKGFTHINLKDLNIFAVDLRYQGDSLEPSLCEAKEYLQIAEEVKKLVLSKVDLS